MRLSIKLVRAMGLEHEISDSEDLIARGWEWWFAWYPVTFAYGEWRWLETVARKAVWIGVGVHFEYRAKP